MLFQHCEGQASGEMARLAAEQSRMQTCERCGAAILTLEGVAVGVGDDTLAHLARFGLAMTGEPLLEHRRESA